MTFLRMGPWQRGYGDRDGRRDEGTLSDNLPTHVPPTRQAIVTRRRAEGWSSVMRHPPHNDGYVDRPDEGWVQAGHGPVHGICRTFSSMAIDPA